MSPIERSGGGGGGTTSPLTTKGDVWGFSNTNDRIPVGTDGQHLAAASTQGLGVQWQTPPGFEFDYVERTSNLTITATSAATAQALIDGNAVTYDGATRILIQVFVPFISCTNAGEQSFIDIWDGATDLGICIDIQGVTGASENALTCIAGRFLTPSAGSHTYHAKTWKSAGAGFSEVVCGAGGAGLRLPAWLRITKA